ncbi:hypothetical protein DSO57_1031676 [Entomophthora muscae]|uniref:Uncharacterized protein n=1 Tax=Entomophthora muscae TaxID=34485 RepID=A0ACC2T0P6_9FUNG|nr:hypothetical protein DSO57_1031676 [Entomophthora muscae]
MWFVGHEPDAHHRLNKVKISQFSYMEDFLVVFQDAANAVLSQHVKSTSGTDCAAAIETFHKLIGIPTFENALPSPYTALISEKEPSTLDKEFCIVQTQYGNYVGCKLNEDTQATSILNPFVSKIKSKTEDALAETMEAKFKELSNRFESLYLAQNCSPCAPCSSTNLTCYNCSEVGHVSKSCTSPAPFASNLTILISAALTAIEPTLGNTLYTSCCPSRSLLQKNMPYLLLLPQAMNKKSNPDYIVDPNRPHFPFKLINPRKFCSHGLSPDHGYTPPPMKRADREYVPSPKHFYRHPLWDSPIPPAANFLAPNPILVNPPAPHLHPTNISATAARTWSTPIHSPPWRSCWTLMILLLVETAPNTPPSSPGPSDFFLQENVAPVAYSSQNTGGNHSEATYNSARHAATGAANE